MVHDSRLIEMVRAASERGGGNLDPDTYTTPHTYHAACLSAGGALRAVDAVISGEADNAFAALRPPGHHATPTHAMGFCLFNNIAIAARHAQQAHGLERVMIVDFDVHHGQWYSRHILRRPLSVIRLNSPVSLLSRQRRNQ